MSKPIRFISNRRYRWMSNFYGSPFTVDNVQYRTVEHAFQAAKTNDSQWKQIILESKTPGDAKRNGRKCPLRPNWEEVKVDTMRTFVRAKFQQNAELREKLLATGQRPIREDSPWDSFWGTGRDGRGKNVMGKILSQIRRELAGDVIQLS